MVDKLIDLMPDFPGKVNHTWCFAHVLNLVAKTVIKQFDAPKKGLFDLNHEELVLANLAARIELEEDEMHSLDRQKFLWKLTTTALSTGFLPSWPDSSAPHKFMLQHTYN